jgi:hypothetical protein
MMYSGYKKNKRVVIVAVLREVDTKEVPEVAIDAVVDEDMEEGEADHPLALTMERLVMCQGSILNCAFFVGTVIASSMSQNTIPTY